jgi:hypothetical protein
MEQPNPVVEEASFLERFFLISKELLRELFSFFFKSQKRNRGLVDEDYNSGVWKKVLEEKKWNRSKDIKEYLLPSTPVESRRVALVDGKLSHISDRDYYLHKISKIQEALKQSSGADDTLVELGCGYGWNLMALADLHYWNRLEGYDISENGIQACRESSTKLGVKIEADILDLMSADAETYSKKLQGKVVFTYFCLEQLKGQIESIVEKLIQAKPKRVIHIETSAGSLKVLRAVDWLTYIYITRKDYQSELKKILLEKADQGKIRLTRAERLYYAPTIKNDCELLCWEPK